MSTSLFSQENLTFGLNSGLTYSNFRGNDFFDDYDYGIDFLIGFSLDYKIKSKLFITTDLNYERKSANYFYDEHYIVEPGGTIIIIGYPIGESPEESPKLKFQTRLEFITIPVMLKYFVDSNNNLYFNGGPYLSYLLNIKNINDGEESDLDFNDAFKKTDLGITFGFGYTNKITNLNNLSLELRNNLGLRSINENENNIFDSTKTNSLNVIFKLVF